MIEVLKKVLDVRHFQFSNPAIKPVQHVFHIVLRLLVFNVMPSKEKKMAPNSRIWNMKEVKFLTKA